MTAPQPQVAWLAADAIIALGALSVCGCGFGIAANRMMMKFAKKS